MPDTTTEHEHLLAAMVFERHQILETLTTAKMSLPKSAESLLDEYSAEVIKAMFGDLRYDLRDLARKTSQHERHLREQLRGEKKLKTDTWLSFLDHPLRSALNTADTALNLDTKGSSSLKSFFYLRSQLADEIYRLVVAMDICLEESHA